MFELNGFWDQYLPESTEDDDFDLEEFLEASAMKAYKNKVKSDVANDYPDTEKKDIKRAAKSAAKDIKLNYKIYKLTCKQSGTKPMSLKDYADVYTNAEHAGNGFTMRNSKQELRKVLESVEEEEFDESFDEFDDFFEASANKIMKNYANDQMDKNHLTDPKVRKEIMKKFKALCKEEYRDYKSDCKSKNEKPMKKKEFLSKKLEESDAKKYHFTKEEIDQLLIGMESAHENLTTGKGSYPQASISIPGGLAETPKAKPYDASSISIPASKEISASEYQKAIDMLVKSYKESYEVLEKLGQLDVVNITLENRQEEFAESAIDDAIMEAYDNGPIFESVNRSDKKEIKRIVSDLRKKIKDALDDMDVKFYQPKIFVRFLRGMVWTTYLWQVVGCCYIESGNISSIVKALNKTFHDELGDYKILPVRVASSIVDTMKLRFGWKNNKKTYFLLIDQKLPTELKQQETSENRTEAIKESVEEEFDESVDDDFDLEEFLEASAMKAYKNKVKSDVANDYPDTEKKDIKRAAKSAAKDIKLNYKIYKLTCKQSGTKPMSLKDYADVYTNAEHAGNGFTMRNSKQELRNV